MSLVFYQDVLTGVTRPLYRHESANLRDGRVPGGGRGMAGVVTDIRQGINTLSLQVHEGLGNDPYA